MMTRAAQSHQAGRVFETTDLNDASKDENDMQFYLMTNEKKQCLFFSLNLIFVAGSEQANWTEIWLKLYFLLSLMLF